MKFRQTGGVPVAGYVRRVVSRSERAGGRTTVYMYLKGDEQGHGTNVPEAATELLPGRAREDAISGRVIRTH